MTIKNNFKNIAAFSFSLIIYFLLLNTLTIFIFKFFLFQKKSFPRKFLRILPSPLRWQYPDIGTTYKSDDLALIGDSYVKELVTPILLICINIQLDIF